MLHIFQMHQKIYCVVWIEKLISIGYTCKIMFHTKHNVHHALCNTYTRELLMNTTVSIVTLINNVYL